MKIKAWGQFQHFKDRTPPWIKLYRDLLNDPDWHSLDAEAAKVLVMLWLVASEDKTHQGILPDLRKLAFRFRMPEKKLSSIISMLSHWLEQDDISVISDRNQVDAPETERETERETETEAANAAFVPPQGLNQEAWARWIDYRKGIKKPIRKPSLEAAAKDLASYGANQSAVVEQSIAQGWQGLFALKSQPKQEQPRAPIRDFTGIGSAPVEPLNREKAAEALARIEQMRRARA